MRIIATKVEVNIKLHKALEFRNEDLKQIDQNSNTLNRTFGNVTSSSEMTFEYRLKPVKKLIQMKDIDLT